VSEIAKIVMVGLDNSGKTSLVLALQKTTNIMSYYSLKPTQGLKITEFKDDMREFRIFELGGQKIYRDEYLKKINKFMVDTEQIIFVIDVQDTTRYELALDYLEAILQNLNDLPLEFCIYLHKFDPGLEIIEQYSIDHLSKVLLNRINTIIPSKYSIKIFKTSIYAQFQKAQIQ